VLKKLIITLTALIFVMTAGCAPAGSDQSVAAKQVCQNLVLLADSIVNFKDVSKFKDTTEMQAYASVVKQNLNNVIQSASSLKTVKLDNLQTAYNDLANAASAIPPGTSLQDAITSVQDQLKAMSVALAQLNTDLDCKNLLPQP
jgi:hypothetical protein